MLGVVNFVAYPNFFHKAEQRLIRSLYVFINHKTYGIKGSYRLPFVLLENLYVASFAARNSRMKKNIRTHSSLEAELALSLLQPWASLVVMGLKKIETRSWQTAHRGPLLIHASLGKKGKVLTSELPFSKYIADFDALPFGAIIGQVELEDIVPVEHLFYSNEKLAALTLEEKAFGDYTKGRYAWVLTNPVMFEEAIPVKGGLGIWKYSAQKSRQ